MLRRATAHMYSMIEARSSMKVYIRFFWNSSRASAMDETSQAQAEAKTKQSGGTGDGGGVAPWLPEVVMDDGRRGCAAPSLLRPLASKPFCDHIIHGSRSARFTDTHTIFSTHPPP
nr:hypothetical protein CFP56_07929 [Quercus suber]